MEQKKYFNLNDNPELKDLWYKMFNAMQKITTGTAPEWWKPSMDKQTFSKAAWSFNKWMWSQMAKDFDLWVQSPKAYGKDLADKFYDILRMSLEDISASVYAAAIDRCVLFLEDTERVDIWKKNASLYRSAVEEFNGNQ